MHRRLFPLLLMLALGGMRISLRLYPGYGAHLLEHLFHLWPKFPRNFVLFFGTFDGSIKNQFPVFVVNR